MPLELRRTKTRLRRDFGEAKESEMRGRDKDETPDLVDGMLGGDQDDFLVQFDCPAPLTKPSRQSTVWRQPDFMAGIVLRDGVADSDE